MKTLKNAEDWHGLWTALVTPLKRQGREIALDEEGLRGLIEDQIRKGIDGLVIAGSTGEGSLLGDTLYTQLLTKALEIVAGRIPLVAGLGIGGTLSCLENAKKAKALGYQGLLAAAPAYVKAPQRGLVEHFLSIARVGLPVCVYEVPGRAASSISVETMQELFTHKDPAAANLIAIKDATGDIDRAMRESIFCKGRAALLTGDDPSFFPFLKSGGDGAISVATHFLPGRMRSIYNAARGGNDAAGVEEQVKINPFVNLLFREANPIPVKTLIYAVGMIQEPLFCPPLVPMDNSLLEELHEAYSAIGDAS
jgi:4-hydroxy-tetrahydrodipicolinate synthase